MISRFFSLTSSEIFLRAGKFLFFITLTNFFTQDIIYQYGYFSAFFSIIFVFSDFGLQTYLLTMLSKSKNNILEFANLSFYRLFVFIFLSLPLIFFYSFSKNEIFLYMFFLFLSDVFLGLQYSFLRAFNDSKKEANIKFLIFFIYIIAILQILVLKNLHVSFIFICISSINISLYNCSFIKKEFVIFFIKNLSFKFFKNTISKSMFIFLGSLATMIYLRIDILMLDWLDTQKSVALYSIASRVLELSMVVPMAISALILPKLANSKNENINFSIIKHFFIGVIVMFLFLFISNYIVQILFRKYIDTIPLLNILLLSIPIMLANNYIFSYFIAKNFSSKYAFITIVIAILNISFNFLVIPKYGFIGAAYATLFTEFLGMILGIYHINKIKKSLF